MSPFASQAEQHVRAWARRFGLVRSPAAAARLDAARFGWFISRVQPDAPRHQLQIYATWHVWLILLDDQYAEGAYRTPQRWSSAVEHLWRVFETGQAAPRDSPAARALADILTPVYARMSACWRARFIAHCRETFAAVQGENRRRQERRIPGVQEYIANRRLVSAVLPCLDLCEFTADSELPAEVVDLPALREASTAANDVISWTNDIFSVAKEEAAGEVDNLVLVLEHARQLSRQAAIRAVSARISQRAAAYLAAERHLTRDLADRPMDYRLCAAVEHRLRSMRHWMTGNLDGSRDSARYTQSPASAPHPPVEDLLTTQA
ncbi:hypothetical protein ACFVH6_07310 [Spirillospora sp. NPDC127200]